MAWVRRFVWMIPVAVVTGGLAFLASEVDHAPFRLNLKTDSLWFVVERDGEEISLDASVLVLHYPTEVESSDLLPAEWQPDLIRTGSAAADSPGSGAPVRLVVFPRAGSFLGITLSSGEKPAVTLASPTQSFGVQLQSSTSTRFEFDADHGSTRARTETASFLTAKIGGNNSSRVTATRASSSNGSARLRVSQIGFANQDRELRTGVIGGELYFMDVPSLELKIFRGTDFRISGEQLLLEALAVTPNGLDVTVSGMARSAAIRVGSLQQPRSLMPTYFDRAQRNPWLIGGVGAASFLISLFGLVLGAPNMFARFRKRVGAGSPSEPSA